jgi:hypothetical protein
VGQHREELVLCAVRCLRLLALGIRHEPLLAFERRVPYRLTGPDERAPKIFDLLQRGDPHRNLFATRHCICGSGEQRQRGRNAPAEKEGGAEAHKQSDARADREQNDRAVHGTDDDRLRHGQGHGPSCQL